MMDECSRVPCPNVAGEGCSLSKMALSDPDSCYRAAVLSLVNRRTSKAMMFRNAANSLLDYNIRAAFFFVSLPTCLVALFSADVLSTVSAQQLQEMFTRAFLMDRPKINSPGQSG